MIFSILYRQEKTRRYFSFYYTYFYVCFSSARNTPCAGNFRRRPLPSRHFAVTFLPCRSYGKRHACPPQPSSVLTGAAPASSKEPQRRICAFGRQWDRSQSRFLSVFSPARDSSCSFRLRHPSVLPGKAHALPSLDPQAADASAFPRGRNGGKKLRAVRAVLHEHFGDSRRNAEVSVNLERRMRVEEVGLQAAPATVGERGGFDETHRLVEAILRLLAVFEPRPDIRLFQDV